MSDKSKIEWTDATWNPVTGCTKISPGCKNCYMFREYRKLANRGVPGYAGGVPDQVRLWPDRLNQPHHWRKPRRVFVCSMADLFHEAVGEIFLARVWGVMEAAWWHIFQVLTKRPDRMLDWTESVSGAVSNIWLGVSVEDQKTADERIPLLLRTPAAVRFVSYEPALGRVDLARIIPCGYYCDESVGHVDHGPNGNLGHIDWVIAGGESGPNSRPSHPDWFRSVRDQCQAEGVPFFFKQWGEWAPIQYHHSDKAFLKISVPMPEKIKPSTKEIVWDGENMIRYGRRKLKQLALSNLLDGREWNEFPQAFTMPW
jgi:protein gp37